MSYIEISPAPYSNTSKIFAEQIIFDHTNAIYLSAYGRLADLTKLKSKDKYEMYNSPKFKLPQNIFEQFSMGQSFIEAKPYYRNYKGEIKIKNLAEDIYSLSYYLNLNKKITNTDTTSGRTGYAETYCFIPLHNILLKTRERYCTDKEIIRFLRDATLKNSDMYHLIVSIVLQDQNFIDQLYNFFNKICTVPILKEWIPYLCTYDLKIPLRTPITIKFAPHHIYADLNNKKNLLCLDIGFYTDSIKNAIRAGLQDGEIFIGSTCRQASPELKEIDNLTDYLAKFSNQLIAKASSVFTPIFNSGSDTFSQKEKDYFNYAESVGSLKFFNAQKNIIAALGRSLKRNKSAILCGEMGTGKTAMSIASVYLNSVKRNPANVVMCPGHLVEKWKREIKRLYPGARAFVISSFSDLIEVEPVLKDSNRKGALFLIISKDIAKINYTERPAVIYDKKRKAFICPRCGEALNFLYKVKMPKNSERFGRTFMNEPSEIVDNMARFTLFLKPTTRNSFCCTSGLTSERSNHSLNKKIKNLANYSCQESLWQSVNNKDDQDNGWIKLECGWLHKDMFDEIKETYELVTPFINRPTNGYISRYVEYINPEGQRQQFPRAYCKTLEKLYFSIIAYEENGAPRQVAPRRYSIAKYLREHYKGRIDYFIADEVHMFSSSSSAQADAFGDLVKTAKSTLALTGTLLNGYSDGIYYILYRMFPRSFQKLDMTYASSKDFVEKFGVEKETMTFRRRTPSSDTVGWQLNKVRKVLPGVSPKIFTNFLLDKTIFISLEDMSSELPQYTEIPIGIELDEVSRTAYDKVARDLMQKMSAVNTTDNSGGDKLYLAFQAAQKMNIYPDQPYDVTPVFSSDGQKILEFPDVIDFKNSKEFVSNKDVKVLEIVKEKIAQGENVLIYVNYTNKTECVDRLLRIFEASDIKACNLTSSVSSVNREAWIEDKVTKGYRVMICNPTLVETGLDLLSFTTIIFYQLNYNLFTMRQASRRSLRLNQPNNVTVYFLYFENTAQETILSLMANKLQAAMAIEGKFTEEGLNAMSNNDDILTQLAESFVNDIKYKVKHQAFSIGTGRPEENVGNRSFRINASAVKEEVKKYSLFSPAKKGRKKFSLTEEIAAIAV